VRRPLVEGRAQRHHAVIAALDGEGEIAALGPQLEPEGARGFAGLGAPRLGDRSRRGLEGHPGGDLRRAQAALRIELADVRVGDERRPHGDEAHRRCRCQEESKDEPLPSSARRFGPVEKAHHRLGIGQLERAGHRGADGDMERESGRC
jgi:hypothetical protein